MAILLREFSLGMNTTLEETLEKYVGNEMVIFVIDYFSRPYCTIHSNWVKERRKEKATYALWDSEIQCWHFIFDNFYYFIWKFSSPSFPWKFGNRWHLQSHRLEANRCLELRWNGSPPYFVHLFPWEQNTSNFACFLLDLQIVLL